MCPVPPLPLPLDHGISSYPDMHAIADLVNHRLDESELKMEDLSTNDAHDEDHDKSSENDSDLIAELRASTIDFEEVLKMKIGTKGATLADMKKRMEDQKNLIIKLRDGSLLHFLRTKLAHAVAAC
jgi:hypothetical protein